MWRETVLYLSLAGFFFWLILWGLNQFLSLRGVVHLLASRIALGLAWAAAVVFIFVVTRSLRAKRNLCFFVLAIVATILAGLLDWWAPKPQMAIISNPKVARPLITIRISPSAFPISAPPRSVLSILPLHPYQTFTDKASDLHAFDNACGEEHFWPSQKEIDTKPESTYEEVRSVEVTNHSQATMETGKAVFRLTYNDSFGGGCMPPSTPTVYQEDVVSIPTLDQQKTFQFFAVNQTSQCAWLLPPAMMTVKMTGDDSETRIPVRFEPINVPNWASSPFPPTTIKWEGVPIKNPGYGIVRTTAQCELPTGEKRQSVLDALSNYVTEGTRIREQFEHGFCVTGVDQTRMTHFETNIRSWHHRVEVYLDKQMGRSYVARLRNQTKPPSSWPCAFDRTYGNPYSLWNSLSSDLERLDEFMKENER